MNSANDVPFTIRPAKPGDEGSIVALLRELAEFERLAATFAVTQADIARDLFGDAPVARCDLACIAGEPAGIALWFRTYRSFRAEAGVFVEDLYVRPQFRGRGLGRALLRHLAQHGPRMEWRVLDWNEKAIAFYRGLGAAPLADWIVYRLEADALERLAS
jgi:GNAT superfamily N-acetyltransferase